MRLKPSRLRVDIETYSTVDLRKATPYRYSEDPDFEILMGSYETDLAPGRVIDLDGPELLERLRAWILDPEIVKVAHNAPFERICFSRALGLPPGEYLLPEDWHDTQAIAAAYGWPKKLENLAPALGAEPKDAAGTALINWFCKPGRNGERRRPEDHPEKWAAFVAYCNQDVRSLIGVDEALPDDFPTPIERLVYMADQRINDRGLPIDLDTVRRAARAVVINHTEHERELSDLTGLDKPGNVAKLREWFRTVGVRMPNMQAETVDEKIAKLDALGEDGYVSPRYRALELRVELAGAASKKFAAADYAVSPDSRIRGAFRYFGAHTGRWSGQGAQPQNLPRDTFANEVDVALAIADLRETGRLTPVELKRLVRPTFTGPSFGADDDLTVVDYSSIEARVIAWLAGEEWALEAFRAGRDIYVETAERMGGLTRAQGKIAVLALGYGGGVGSLRAMAGPGDDFVNDKSDEEIRESIVIPWRRANPAIARFWHRLEDAFGDGEGRAGRITVSSTTDPLGHAVSLHLPSGRAISYHGVRHESFRVPVTVVLTDQRTGVTVSRKIWRAKTGWRYANPQAPFNSRQRIQTYGGRLAENVTQAAARDVLAAALVRLDRHGYRVVGHVHDEAMVEGSDLAEISRVMRMRPQWARGLPVDAEGFVTNRYKKG